MRDIFILSCAPAAQGGGVYKYQYYKGGALEQRGCLACDCPMYAVQDNGRLHILLLSPFADNKNSGYFSCRTDLSDGTELKNTLGECACHLAADGGDVYIVNYLSGNIVQNCEKSVRHQGRGINLPRQDKPHTHFAAFSPDGKRILCCDLGLDTVFLYDRNLREVARGKVPAGYGVRHLTFSKDGNTVYAVNELHPSVSVFSFDGEGLVLRGTTVLPCEKPGSTGAAIRCSEDGKRVYVSVRAENAIFVLKAEGETLTVVQKVPCGGDSPRDFNLFGDMLICCNEKSDNVSIWKLQSGLLQEQLPSLSLPSPLCVL